MLIKAKYKSIPYLIAILFVLFIITKLIYEFIVAEPEFKGNIFVNTKPGFWEMFRYRLYKLFN